VFDPWCAKVQMCPYKSGARRIQALSARPTGFLQCFDTVGLVIWPVKIVPDMTYHVLSGMLNLAQSISQGLWHWLGVLVKTENTFISTVMSRHYCVACLWLFLPWWSWQLFTLGHVENRNVNYPGGRVLNCCCCCAGGSCGQYDACIICLPPMQGLHMTGLIRFNCAFSDLPWWDFHCLHHHHHRQQQQPNYFHLCHYLLLEHQINRIQQHIQWLAFISH